MIRRSLGSNTTVRVASMRPSPAAVNSQTSKATKATSAVTTTGARKSG
jgi:hypothetical protein